MRKELLLSFSLCLGLACGLSGQKQTDIDGALAHITSGSRDISQVTNYLLAMECDMVDLLVEVAKVYDLRYEIPRDARPDRVLSPFRQGRDAHAAAREGFAALNQKIEMLRASLQTKADRATVKQTAEEVVVLMWALKGHCILESLDIGRTGTVETQAVPGGEPDYILVNTLGRLARHNMRVRLGLLEDAVDSWAHNAGGMAERRRQAEMVGLDYPNASNPVFW